MVTRPSGLDVEAEVGVQDGVGLGVDLRGLFAVEEYVQQVGDVYRVVHHRAAAA